MDHASPSQPEEQINLGNGGSDAYIFANMTVPPKRRTCRYKASNGIPPDARICGLNGHELVADNTTLVRPENRVFSPPLGVQSRFWLGSGSRTFMDIVSSRDGAYART